MTSGVRNHAVLLVHRTRGGWEDWVLPGGTPRDGESMYDLAHSFYYQQPGNALILRAERQPDGRRTFRPTEGEPLPTSYGEDSYRRIFGTTEPAHGAGRLSNAVALRRNTNPSKYDVSHHCKRALNPRG